MTYCCGLLLNEGLVMVADTRTNAGVDNISTFKKLHVVEAPDRYFVMATAGNLSVTQSALHQLTTPGEDGVPATLHAVADMYQAARRIGEVTAEVRHRVGAAIEPAVPAGVTLLFGGQIAGGPMRFFLIYDEGNFIECEPDTPFLQAGETKYGKPILVRSIAFDTEIYEALKITLVSFDSTIKSNLAVGAPLDVVVLRRDALKPELSLRIEAEDPYFHDLGEQWSEALRSALHALPGVPYGRG